MATLLDTLASYEISRVNGFVPDQPSRSLGSDFHDWESAAATLPQFLARGDFQTLIHDLPVFDVNKLDQPTQWQRAYVILGFLTHAWVHGCNQASVPPILAEPFLQVCDRIGMEPVLSYAGLCLYNWVEGSGNDTVCGHRAVVTFTGTFDEVVFYLVPVLVEKEGGVLVTRLLDAQQAAGRQEWAEVLALLESCVERLEAMTKSLEELKPMDPEIFYQEVRPYIAGLNVTFERQHKDDVKHNLIGGSAAQSALFQVIDHLLGVRHKSSLPTEMRSYMPGSHRRFIQGVEELPAISYLLSAGDLQDEIRGKLHECLSELKTWRSKHIAVVTRYIMLPAQAAARRTGTKKTVAGTAGSSPVVFLKEMRDDTLTGGT